MKELLNITDYNSFLINEMAISKEIYGEINPDDKIIMSTEEEIIPKDVSQSPSNSFKPRGLWYAIGTEWVDWVRGNMPEWESDHIYKIELDDSKILHLGEDMSYAEFEQLFGADFFTSNYGDYKSPSNIKWWKVKAYDGGKYSGIEIKDPWGDIKSWLRTWDISSGCIWRANAIKNIIKIK